MKNGVKLFSVSGNENDYPFNLNGVLGIIIVMLSEVYASASVHLDFVDILFSFHFFINRLSSGKDVW